MGMVIDGRWSDEDRSVRAGAFARRPSVHADDISAEVVESIAVAPGRFHLVASLSCPWSHRATIMRSLKRLEDAVPLQVAGGERTEGYRVNGGQPWVVPGAGETIVHLHQLYTLDDPHYSGGATVPVLWDAERRRIVSNESAKIMRALDAVAGAGDDVTFVPVDLRVEIDALNATIHDKLSNAVYRAGMAQAQAAYDAAVADVFTTLDALEVRLTDRRYLFGATITESDWRLFPTLVRFDTVYHTHFRCTRRRLIDTPALWAYARDLYAWRGIADGVDFEAIREGYYRNDGSHNPHRIVAQQPDADWTAPHGREALGPAEIARRDGTRAEIEPATLRVRETVGR